MYQEAGNVNSFKLEKSPQVTCGDFKSEKDACLFFDTFMEGNDFFSVEKEVSGRLLFDSNPRKAEQGWSLRIDRILHPSEKAFDSGWLYGSIGIEIKQSGIKVAGAIAQIIEQKNSVFWSRKLLGTRILPVIFALFPARQTGSDLGSIFAQSNIVSCYYHNYTDCLRFVAPPGGVLDISRNSIEIGPWNPSSKKGHRGSK